MRNKTIQYGIDQETGLVISRQDNKVAIPVLDFEGMNPENNFETNFDLQSFDVFDTLPLLSVKWTKKISKEIKNKHRAFFGMKPLK